MNCGAVISNEETKWKSFVNAQCLYPRVALLDRELTMSVPRDQTAYGV
jgi:alcohol dehydrogenase YqhD (iron-dependent ADH family)